MTANEWTFIASGVWQHPVYGRVIFDEAYGRTYRANSHPSGNWRTLLRSPSGRSTRFRSKEAAMRALVAFHSAKESGR